METKIEKRRFEISASNAESIAAGASPTETIKLQNSTGRDLVIVGYIVSYPSTQADAFIKFEAAHLVPLDFAHGLHRISRYAPSRTADRRLTITRTNKGGVFKNGAIVNVGLTNNIVIPAASIEVTLICEEA